MASKLFRALVCFGISLGGGGTGCTRALEDARGPVEGAADDAAADAAPDVPDAAFDDAPWPTTKGGPVMTMSIADPSDDGG